MEKQQGDPVTLFQRAKVQAEVLVPLLRHLRNELGEETANGLVYPVIRTCMKDWIADIAPADSGDPMENFHRTSETLATLFEGDVDMQILESSPESLAVDVTGCRFADYFRRLGEPELGAILTCELDDHIAEMSALTVQLRREATLMKGAARCPFRYRFESEGGGE
jgi:predicted ArsR family transcriptional regulator